MKIGLLTYYGDLNCGTNMQALATFQAIKKVYPLMKEIKEMYLNAYYGG